jgi:hypothetical protein
MTTFLLKSRPAQVRHKALAAARKQVVPAAHSCSYLPFKTPIHRILNFQE